MNLKYYLRGLGIGLIVTTLILAISHNIKGPSLMDNYDPSQNESTGSIIAYTKAEETKASEVTKSLEETDETDTADEVTTVTEKTTEAAQKETKQTETKATTASGVNNQTKEQASTGPNKNEKKVKLTISSGDYSESVSQMLYDLGAIDSKKSFNDYLKKHGYSRNIKTGVYTITTGDSYENIAKTITGKK